MLSKSTIPQGIVGSNPTPTAQSMSEIQMVEKVAKQSLEEGFYAFRRYDRYTDVRFNVPILMKSASSWASLAKEALLKTPTGGIISRHFDLLEKIPWINPIAELLVRNGVELPYTGIPDSAILYGNDKISSGIPLRYYNENSKVTIFHPVNTFGDGMVKLIDYLHQKRITVGNAISLIDRNPDLVTELKGVPYQTLCHYPLQLYTYEEALDRWGLDASEQTVGLEG